MIVQSNTSDKRASILKSTLELIKDNGFHGTPISLIAQRAGVSCGTIYYYFPSKDSIIIELHREIKSLMIAEMFPPESDGKEYKDQFFDGWISLCKYLISNPESLQFIEQFNNSPFAKMAKANDLKASENEWYRFFKSGMEKGYIKKIEYRLIASVAFGCIASQAKYLLAEHAHFDDDDIGKIAQILWNGIKT